MSDAMTISLTLHRVGYSDAEILIALRELCEICDVDGMDVYEQCYGNGKPQMRPPEPRPQRENV